MHLTEVLISLGMSLEHVFSFLAFTVREGTVKGVWDSEECMYRILHQAHHVPRGQAVLGELVGELFSGVRLARGSGISAGSEPDSFK